MLAVVASTRRTDAPPRPPTLAGARWRATCSVGAWLVDTLARLIGASVSGGRVGRAGVTSCRCLHRSTDVRPARALDVVADANAGQRVLASGALARRVARQMHWRVCVGCRRARGGVERDVASRPTGCCVDAHAVVDAPTEQCIWTSIKSNLRPVVVSSLFRCGSGV